VIIAREELFKLYIDRIVPLRVKEGDLIIGPSAKSNILLNSLYTKYFYHAFIVCDCKCFLS